MITGAHFLLYSSDADADRAFFRDVLEWQSVDVGGGWLIFKLPPSELAVHPSEGSFVQQHAEHDLLGAVLYLLCDDVRATIRSLEAKNVLCTPIAEAEWGHFTIVALPSGGHIGLYQPTHPTAVDLS
jgi:predicted enzyme related to lactoylglutathione lyase